MTRQASGYKCPQCGDDYLQWVTDMSKDGLLQLKCSYCGYEWIEN